jgi:hypothetical protein
MTAVGDFSVRPLLGRTLTIAIGRGLPTQPVDFKSRSPLEK